MKRQKKKKKKNKKKSKQKKKKNGIKVQKFLKEYIGDDLRPYFSRAGSVDLILGCMFSGKSTELLRRLRIHRIARRKVCLISHAKDTRHVLLNQDENPMVADLQFGKPSTIATQSNSPTNKKSTRILKLKDGEFKGVKETTRLILPIIQTNENLNKTIRENKKVVKTEDKYMTLHCDYMNNFQQMMLNPSPDDDDDDTNNNHVKKYKQRVKVTFKVPTLTKELIFEIIENKYDVVGIDEAQFFGEQLSWFADYLANKGIIVILAMLNGNFRRKNFEGISAIYGLADNITMLKAVCLICYCANATASFRLGDSEKEVEVGGKKSYIGVCRQCFNTLMVKREIKKM